MNFWVTFLVLVSLCLQQCFTDPTPPNLKVCNKKRTDFSDCLKNAAQEAIQKFVDDPTKLGFPSIHAIKIDKMQMMTSGGSTISMDVKTSNVTIYNADKVQVEDFSFDYDACLFKFRMFLDNFIITGHYEMTGKLLIMALDGDGFFNSTMTGLDTEHELKCERFDKKGEKYIRITDYKLRMAVKKVNYYLENLFKGNPELSEQILKAFNDNWQMVFDESKPAAEATFAEIYKQYVNRFFSKFSDAQLFLDERGL